MNAPLISIGITYYRASDTIEKAVSSALAQTWKNTEIIIVNDGSDDDNETTLNALKQKNQNISVIHQPFNKGVAASRNEIIRRANGEFLAFFDDDDESLPERLQKQYDRIVMYENNVENNAPIICHTARIQKYSNGQERIEPTLGTNNGIAPHGKEVALRILTGKPQPHIFGSTATCSQMARISTYKNLGGFDESFKRSEDTDFNVRAAIDGAHFPGISTPLVVQSMTLTSDKKLTDEKDYTLKLLQKHEHFIKQHANYPFCHKWIVAKYDCLQKKHTQFLLKIMTLFIMHPVLTLQRFIWAAPNLGFNLQFIRFHHDKT